MTPKLITLLLLFIFVQRSLQFRCYKCVSSSYDPYNSYRGPTERECLTDSHLVSCYGDCIKEVYYNQNAEVTRRDCAFEQRCYNQPNAKHCSICSSDRCNGASGTSATLLLIAIPFIMGFSFRLPKIFLSS